MSDYGDMDTNRMMQNIQKKVKDKMKPKPKDIIKTVIKAAVMKLLAFMTPMIIGSILIFSIVDFLTGGGDSQASSGNIAGTYNGTLTGNTREEQIWNFLIQNGATKVGAAAMMGCMYGEQTQFDPTSSEKYYDKSGKLYAQPHGICQWTTESGRFGKLEAYAKEKGTSWDDLQTQLEFMWKEIIERVSKNQKYTS